MELANLEGVRDFFHLVVNELITNKTQNIFSLKLNILAS